MGLPSGKAPESTPWHSSRHQFGSGLSGLFCQNSEGGSLEGVPGISRGGRRAEDLFCKLTGAVRATSAAMGDAVLEGNLVEIKQASSNTLNQVRAVKYIPLVAFDVRDETWYVVPASAVVVQVGSRIRGQHTENPFESATISLTNIQRYRLDDPAQLRSAVLSAVEEAGSYPRLAEAMKVVLEESRRLARESIETVRKALRESGLA